VIRRTWLRNILQCIVEIGK